MFHAFWDPKVVGYAVDEFIGFGRGCVFDGDNAA
jgi:hypothetical protein